MFLKRATLCAASQDWVVRTKDGVAVGGSAAVCLDIASTIKGGDWVSFLAESLFRISELALILSEDFRGEDTIQVMRAMFLE